jgi:UDP-N-acetylglucosamine acyltransferase
VIHPTALIHPQAKLDSTISIGPYSVIDAGVEIGPNCVIGPHVYITGATVIGPNNRFHAGCVIGDAPQDLKYRDEPTRVRIGEDNVFREHVTVHRSATLTEDTVIGSHNFLMANAHVAHNCIVGDHIILANGVMLGGHAVVQDRAFISGSCLVHQFVRIGRLALMQGGSAVSKDLPPFTVGLRVNEICGLNVIGLRRAGIAPNERLELKKLYRELFRAGRNLGSALAEARPRFTGTASRELLDFVASAKRGVCADVSGGSPSERENEPG